MAPERLLFKVENTVILSWDPYCTTRGCSAAMQVPWVWVLHFLEGVMFVDVDGLTAHITEYFGSGLWAQLNLVKKLKLLLLTGAHNTFKQAGLLEDFINKHVWCCGCGQSNSDPPLVFHFQLWLAWHWKDHNLMFVNMISKWTSCLRPVRRRI